MQENGKIVVGTKIDTKGIDEGLKDIDKKVTAHDVSQLFSKGLGQVKGLVKNLASSIGNIFSKTVSLVGTVAKGVIGAIGGIFTVVKLILKSITKSIIKITLASLGLSATFGAVGIVGALIVKAFKKVGEENNELIANIRYLVYVIGQMLTPVANSTANMISQSIRNIINLLAKVITYVAYIINAWFGINILANVSKDAFMAMQKSTDGTADNIGKASKNAKDLKKQLAGFDEMNILQDNSSTGGASGGGIGDVGGVGDMTMPTLEIGGEVPEWIKWIADNKDLVISALAGITAGLVAMKLLGLDPIMSLGIGLIIAGIVLLIQDIIKFVNDPTWENFANILRDISIILAGIALVMIAIDVANPVGWIILAVAAVVALVAVIIKNWDKIKEVLGEIGNWIKINIIDPVVEFFVGLWETIKQGCIDAWENIQNIFGLIVEWLDTTIIQPIVGLITSIIDTVVLIVTSIYETIKAGIMPIINIYISLFKTIFDNILIVIDNIKKIIRFLWEAIKIGFETAWAFISGIVIGIANWVNDNMIKPVANFINMLYESVKVGIRIAWEYITNILKTISTWINKNVITPISNFFSGLWNGIIEGVKGAINFVKKIFNGLISFFGGIINTILGFFREIGAKVGEVIGRAFVTVINGILGAIERILNFPIRAINKLTDVINKVPGLNLSKLNTFNLPRLAKGTILNNPGQGVPVAGGRAIAGEAGREAYLPLSDSQLLEELGSTIGKYITVNLTNVTDIDGRTIARKVTEINNNNNFLLNR